MEAKRTTEALVTAAGRALGVAVVAPMLGLVLLAAPTAAAPAPVAPLAQAAELSSLALPACVAQRVSTAYEKKLELKLSCATNAGATVSRYRIVDAPADGRMSRPKADGSVTYTPAALFSGTERFTFDALGSDGAASQPATVTIQVGAALPPPVQGKSANLFRSRGENWVTLPGQTGRVHLTGGLHVPVGAIVDARDGRVGVLLRRGDGYQAADFASGRFKIVQGEGSSLVKVELQGDPVTRRCAIHLTSYSGSFDPSTMYTDDPSEITKVANQVAGERSVASAAAAKGKKRATSEGKPSRRLWGRDSHGRFTTVGHGSSASVLGTGWMVFDYPDGTLTFVVSGSVTVHDFHARRTVRLDAGRYYFAATGDLPPC
jgi:hypothetical protein